MLLKKIIVQVDTTESFIEANHLKISRSICRKWKLPHNGEIILQFGNVKENVIIHEIPTLKTPTMEIAPILAKKLLIPYEILPIHCLYKQEENTLKLGPIISCVTNQMYHEEQKFGSMTTFFEEMARFAKDYHICFFVTPLKKWEEQFRGYTYQQNIWHEEVFPNPDALYNRIGSRAFETSSSFKAFTSYLNEHEIAYFNHRFLDKWDIYESLISFPEMSPYLPKTCLLDDYESFCQMLTIHECIFLKPVNGSQGRQILRIEKEADDYVVYYSSFSEERFTRFTSSYLLFKRLKERIRDQRFLIQEGIRLIHLDDRPLDFRILCIKDGLGQWRVISSVARISAKEKKVSNLAQGGEQKRPIDVLTPIFDEKLAKQYMKLMGELSIEVASLISESNEGHFGELGVDIALDKDGGLWIIEVNSKPSKKDFVEPKEQIRPSTKALLLYLTFLCGYPQRKTR